jgi:hypothetical protein
MLLSCAPVVLAQEEPPTKSAPAYDDTFGGPIIELTALKVTVSRNVLGKTEKRTFLITKETRIEGKLKVKEKVTVGFVSTDQGDVARLIVAHPAGNKK